MAKNYRISQKVAIARALIIVFCRSALLQHDDHHVLQDGTMNINEKS